MFTKFCRGMVYWANPIDLTDENPNLQKGMRPYIIVSNNVANAFSNLVTIVPCTTNTNRQDISTHVQLKLGKEEYSTALCEQIMTVNNTTLKTFMGMIDERDMRKIDVGLLYALGMKELPSNKEPVTAEQPIINMPTKRVRIDGEKDMREFMEYANTHDYKDTMAKYNLTNMKQIAQRIWYYKKKLGVK